MVFSDKLVEKRRPYASFFLIYPEAEAFENLVRKFFTGSPLVNTGSAMDEGLFSTECEDLKERAQPQV
jgi:hypothetical protein